jgi:ATP-dependent helicase/nuclease subunit B
MADITQIEIQLAGWTIFNTPNITMWNKHKGGREVLLRWLENQLGLLEEPVPLSSRITEYACAMDSVPGGCFAKSLQTDRWTTATEIFSRFEELCLAGWNGKNHKGLPPIVQDLAKVTIVSRQSLSDQGIRLKKIIDALDSGQGLPPHRCILWDPLDRWPTLYRDIFSHLAVEDAPTIPPMAPPGTALAKLQEQIISFDVKTVNLDKSFRWIRSRSIFGACEAIAVALGREPGLLDETVVCCENSAAALCLDGCLARLGLPTMGASINTLSHPALQVLPITLALCWEPVDPALLLDFLSLPIGPIPRHAAKRLAEALAEQPGFDSTAWERVWQELCSPEKDPDSKLASKLKTWLKCERTSYGHPIPINIIRERCRLVAQWAAGRAATMESSGNSNPEITKTLRIAAGQASALAELAASQGHRITEPQLGRLLEAAIVDGVQVQPHLEAAGGPRLVKSLAEIEEPYKRLVWLGLGTEDLPACRWTALELQQIREAGIDIDDGSRQLAALRDAERRGFCRVTGSVMTVSLPGDIELRPHLLWQQVQSTLEKKVRRRIRPWRWRTYCTVGSFLPSNRGRYRQALPLLNLRSPGDCNGP